MTGPRQSREDRSADQLLAGKYVLGLLSEDTRRGVETRMRRDRSFARMVMQWSQNMASVLDEDEAGDRRPIRPAVVGRSRPRPRGPKRGLFVLAIWHIWRSVAFWRTATLLMFVLVLTLLAA